jgi:tryptophan halogenase
MDAGWCWQIEHDEIINRGYVFSSDFLTDEQAEAEFRRKNPLVGKTGFVPFPAGVHARTWVKNVIAIGNAAGFVEPLEATAIATICDSVSHVIRSLQASNRFLEPLQRDIYNRIFHRNWEIIRDFLAIHYKFNRRLDTPFWQAARRDVCLGDAQEIVDYYQVVGPDLRLLNYDMKRDFFSVEGYLVMLVGQQVPFQRREDVTDQARVAWQERQGEWTRRARQAMTMADCLADLRENGLPGFDTAPGDEETAALSRSGFGELRWQ